ncbi:hypothetical protein FEM48_Zijuj01G0203400 [Ziziphus jujuba var. spinosa]|uniref:Disease resistance protein At4g27220 n=1 Tax=Ziziphus jujuba var. spinosa TaxID=714518 RepID=A0A978W3C9_ZIZJJ|nr:hypothetical protein FEM48_Zijuj01G0203400 [Ziziphus jujuba var. spinosa]
MDLSAPLVELVKIVSTPIRRSWKHHRSVNKYMKILNEKLEELNCQKEDNESKLRQELLPGKTLKKEVELWLGKVKNINSEIRCIEIKVGKVKYLHRSCLGKVVCKKIQEVEELYQKGCFPDGFVEPCIKNGDVLPTMKLAGETTLKRKVEEIWESLMNDEVRKIGVYGMGGIGKTTAIKHINNQLLEKKDKFDNVIWVTVSKASNVFKLQDAVACKLDLDISKYEDETTRAAKIYAAFCMKNRYVLILDDLWEVYNLEDVGIPEPTLENGSKLLLTTRSLVVCRGMGSKDIEMELLTKEESRNLFLDVVGNDVLSVPNLEATVNEVIEECSCLPLAVVTVAGSLKGVVDICEWRTALEELRAPTKGPNEIGSTILEKLKFSYERLKDKKLQDCLLYCALYPEDHNIPRDELIEDLIVEGIIDGLKSRQAEFHKGHTMLNKLKNVCLLKESILGDEWVRMHDLIRDMALQITSSDPHFLVEAGTGLEDIPDVEIWPNDLAKVSLMFNKISEIPSNASPICPKLLTLRLNFNRLTCIPDCFFVHMTGLNLLDLSYTDIESLPKSISNLVTLTALSLRGCMRLKFVPSLTNLRALQRLDFRNTKITEVPDGTEMLINLRYLNLQTRAMEKLPDGILPKLSRLQYLVFPLCGLQILKPRAEELVCLRKLETFRGILHDVNDFNTYIGSMKEARQLAYYTLQVGTNPFPSRTYGYQKAVILINWDASENIAGNQYPILLPEDVEYLSFEKCHNIRSLSNVVSLKNASELRKCFISNCHGIEHFLSSSSLAVPLLQSLEELKLVRLWDLRSLILREKGTSPLFQPGSTFGSLRKIEIYDCPNIKQVFTLGLLLSVQNLEEIYVKNCCRMVNIVAAELDGEDEDGNQNLEGTSFDTRGLICLSKLRVLTLEFLPELKSFYSSESALFVAVSLQQIILQKCPKLKKIPVLGDEPCPPPSLQNIKVEQDWWESLEWNNPNNKDALQPLCHFQTN